MVLGLAGPTLSVTQDRRATSDLILELDLDPIDPNGGKPTSTGRSRDHAVMPPDGPCGTGKAIRAAMDACKTKEHPKALPG